MTSEILDDVKIYLPKYLSEEQQAKLFDELSAFPENVDGRFYTSFLKDEEILFQGDGFKEVSYPDYENQKFRTVKGFLVSNTCDSNLGNTRMFTPYISVAPIFSLQKWQDVLLSNFPEASVQSHVDAIRRQRVSQFFYLPVNGAGTEEMFVRFDCVFSIPAGQELEQSLLKGRLFTLSNYGFYMLLVKLGIHLTRIQERVDRDKDPSSSTH